VNYVNKADLLKGGLFQRSERVAKMKKRVDLRGGKRFCKFELGGGKNKEEKNRGVAGCTAVGVKKKSARWKQ